MYWILGLFYEKFSVLGMISLVSKEEAVGLIAGDLLNIAEEIIDEIWNYT